jgi:hypothetical protein
MVERAGMDYEFELVGEITDIQAIAVNLGIRELKELKTRFGDRCWRS